MRIQNSVVWWVASYLLSTTACSMSRHSDARTEGGVSPGRFTFEQSGNLEDALRYLTIQIVESMVILWAGATGSRASAELYVTDLSLKYK